MGIRKIPDNFDFLRPKQPSEMRHLKRTISTCITNAFNVKGVLQYRWVILKIIAEFIKCEFMVPCKRQALVRECASQGLGRSWHPQGQRTGRGLGAVWM